MALGGGGWRHERRMRRRRWIVRLIFVLALGAGAIFTYAAGQETAKIEVGNLLAEVDRLKETVATLKSRDGDLATSFESARVEADRWKSRFESEIPNGEVQDLLAKVRRQIESGVRPERLALLIQAAERASKCAATPVSKRFIVRTSLTASGVSDSVTFADNAITVTASGVSALSAGGKAEARFDPAKPITLSFVHLGGGKEEVQGVLPLSHTVALKGEEIRVSAVPGETSGFLRVTAERCEPPAEATR